MNSAQIRRAFLDYFAEQGHTKIHSSPVVPHDDPTLLFTNAGMVQFKDCFLGTDQRPYTRATSVQRCVRAGGKHNDLENVGYTARHHTFFEMLGNFSFGDYFKREAIQMAWALLTERLQIPKEKLWVTVFEEDDEAAQIWINEIGVDPNRLSRCGAKDNFWAMGDTGPCGPCSEIFYDHGEGIWGGPPGTPEEDGDRYIEIWNLVFMQYERSADGTLTPLPKPSVDTGMGLERLAAVLQGVHSNYEIDTFVHLLAAVKGLAPHADPTSASLKVLADHIRSCSFMIVDGVLPSNEGRGYVLRRIIRRAIRHGYKLGINDTFFYKLVKPLVEVMGSDYPELGKAQSEVERALKQEEERFAETLEHGMKILEADINALSGSQISGETAFKLYDTYGFPLDLTADIARERNLSIDAEGFERAMNEQRERARAASHFGGEAQLSIDFSGTSAFVGYDNDRVESSQVVGLFREGQAVSVLSEGQTGQIILDQTPFYAESGGQLGDRGSIHTHMHSFHVNDTKKVKGVHVCMGQMTAGEIKLGDYVTAQVDQIHRRASERNHSATHLLHAALRQHLGTHVAQKGSLVSAERLRFDFSHFEPINEQTLRDIEATVNRKIMENHPVICQTMNIDEAKELGAMALFGEKYGDIVRVVSMSPFSIELCGGTHVLRTGDIGPCRIISETGTASGVRRIEAVTGEGAWSLILQDQQRIQSLAAQFKAKPEQVLEKVAQLNEKLKQAEKELELMKAQKAAAQGGDLISAAKSIGSVTLISAKLEGVDAKILRETLDQLKNKIGSGVVVLACVEGEKVSLAAGVTKDLVGEYKAGELVNFVAQQVGGKGGGRPDMAMAGGTDASKLHQALASVELWISEKQ